MAAGADVNAADSHGVTPLQVAQHLGCVDMVDALVAAGAGRQAGSDASGSELHSVQIGYRNTSTGEGGSAMAQTSHAGAVNGDGRAREEWLQSARGDLARQRGWALEHTSMWVEEGRVASGAQGSSGGAGADVYAARSEDTELRSKTVQMGAAMGVDGVREAMRANPTGLPAGLEQMLGGEQVAEVPSKMAAMVGMMGVDGVREAMKSSGMPAGLAEALLGGLGGAQAGSAAAGSEHIAKLAGPGAVVLAGRLANSIASGAPEQLWGPLEVECSEMDSRGWHISQAVGMMQHMGVRDSGILTEGIDPRSTQIVRHILGLVTSKEDESGGDANATQAQTTPTEVLSRTDSDEALAEAIALSLQHESKPSNQGQECHEAVGAGSEASAPCTTLESVSEASGPEQSLDLSPSRESAPGVETAAREEGKDLHSQQHTSGGGTETALMSDVARNVATIEREIEVHKWLLCTWV